MTDSKYPRTTDRQRVAWLIEIAKDESISRAFVEAFVLVCQDLTDCQQALYARKTIERAKGLLMTKHTISEERAYRMLRDTSQDRAIPMVKLAEEILTNARA